MSLINRAVEFEPSRAYLTASRREMQLRLDRSLGVIERILSARVSRFDKAKSDFNVVRLKTSEAHEQIKKWQSAHKGVSKLSTRMDGTLYDRSYFWSYGLPAKKYAKLVDNRVSKHRSRVKSSIEDLRSYVDYFNERYAFIQKGFSWLKINPPKVNLVSEVQSAFADLFATEVVDGIERLILRDAEILEDGEIVRRDIISSDSEEMVVSKPSEVVAVRKAAKIEVRNKRIDDGALVGDGVHDRDVFELVARIAEPGYLNTAVQLHFYKTGLKNGSRNYYYPKTYPVDLDRFMKNRRQATNFSRNVDEYVPHDKSLMQIRYDAGVNPLLSLYDVPYNKYGHQSPSVDFSIKKRRAELPRDPRVTNNSSEIYNFETSPYIRIVDDVAGNAFSSLACGIPTVISGGPGSGKTTLLTSFISGFSRSGAVTKVIGGGGSLDVIERNLLKSISDRKFYQEVSVERGDGFILVRPIGDKSTFLRGKRIFEGDGPHITVIDEASLIDMSDEFLNSDRLLLVVGDLFQIAKEGSVLDWAERSGLPIFTLEKNYRAKNADLMAWSSIFRYESAVVMEQHGSRLSGVCYVPMAKKINGVVMAEARAVSNAAIAAMNKGGSVAVIAFSKKQLSAIFDCMGAENIARLKFAGLPEDIQGKEADHVFVSIGAALTAGGKTPRHINGLDDEMGIARMNVILSRALYSNTIFSGIIESDIDLRVASASQAILLSVLKTHEMLPSENLVASSQFYNFEVAKKVRDITP